MKGGGGREVDFRLKINFLMFQVYTPPQSLTPPPKFNQQLPQSHNGEIVLTFAFKNEEHIFRIGA